MALLPIKCSLLVALMFLYILLVLTNNILVIWRNQERAKAREQRQIWCSFMRANAKCIHFMSAKVEGFFFHDAN
jgi:hypothetical protein